MPITSLSSIVAFSALCLALVGGRGGSSVGENEFVPTVDSTELKKTVATMAEIKGNEQANQPAGREPVFSARRAAFKPVSDPEALWFRAAMLLLPQAAGPGGFLAPWINNGEFDDAVIKVAAKFPMKKMQPGVDYRELPFDVQEMIRQISHETAK